MNAMSESDSKARIRALQRIWRRHGVYLDRSREDNPLSERRGEDPFRHLVLTVITSRADPKITFHASTIWLGYSAHEGRPRIFETTMFASVHRPDQRVQRDTETEARRGHDETVTLAAATFDDPDRLATEELGSSHVPPPRAWPWRPAVPGTVRPTPPLLGPAVFGIVTRCGVVSGHGCAGGWPVPGPVVDYQA